MKNTKQQLNERTAHILILNIYSWTWKYTFWYPKFLFLFRVFIWDYLCLLIWILRVLGVFPVEIFLNLKPLKYAKKVSVQSILLWKCSYLSDWTKTVQILLVSCRIRVCFFHINWKLYSILDTRYFEQKLTT